MKKILSIGIKPYHNFRHRSIIQVLNFCALMISLALLAGATMNFINNEWVNAVVVLTFTLIYSSILFLNHLNYFLLSKIILCFGITATPFINVLLTGRVPPGQYMSFVTVALIFAFLSFLLFNTRKERFLYYFSCLYYILWLIFIDRIIYNLSVEKADIQYIFDHYYFYKMPAIFGLIALFFIITALRNIIYSFEEENEAFKEELKEKNHELATINELLEARVKDRTKELTATNKKLINLAFITSHELRGPLASIMGITEILKSYPEDQDTLSVLPKLHEKSVEMDDVITRMQKALDEKAKKMS